VATLEYTALAVVVSAALAVGGAVVDAPALPSAVGAQLRRAYCVVAGGDCFARGGPRPCVVGSRTRLVEHRVALAVLRLRDGRSVLIEERSDGTVRVTVLQATGGGAGVQLGLDLRLFGRGVSADVDAEAAGSVGYARTFLAADRAAAARLVSRLDGSDAPVAGALPGLVRFARGGGGGEEAERTASVSTHAEAEAALRALRLGPRAAMLRHVTGTVRVDRRSGDVGIGLRLGGETLATLGASLAQVGGGTLSAVEAELVLDRARRPRELVLRGAGGVHGEAQLASGGAAGGSLRRVQARVDLTDPATRALADRLVHGDAGAVRALAGRARVDVAYFATERDERTVGGRFMGSGGSRYTLSETATLVAAEGREPGLGWSRRLDCVR
jgi:hypothetical protein